MATNLLPIHPLSVRASAISGNRKTSSTSGHRKTSSVSGSGNACWWSPLFGWSSNADYIDSKWKEDDPANFEETPATEQKPARSRFAPGCFTKEKAKQLRMKTAMDSGNFHDVMYHSAIASRLASDFSRRSDGK